MPDYINGPRRWLCLGLMWLSTGIASAQQGELVVPPPAQVLATMERAADWQLAHPSGHAADDWTEAVGDMGLLALSGISGQQRYRAVLQASGQQNGWKLGPRTYHADDHAIGQMYLELFQQTRQSELIAPMRAQFDAILSQPPAGPLDWHHPAARTRWSWCDALFMAPPAWARLSAVTGDPRYLEYAIARWWETSAYLYDPQEHLYYRDSRYLQQRGAHGEKVFWGRGNGWVMAGLVRMLQYIPADHPQRQRFVQQLREMSARLRQLQHADGLWRTSLLDGASYPQPETSATALYTYALAWGVNQGLLDQASYQPVVLRGWQGLARQIDGAGRLQYVQPIGEDPRQVAADSTEVYGVGALLLAGTELYRMALAQSPELMAVTVSNPAATLRLDESVVLRGSGVNKVVMDALTSRILPSQVVDDGLLFQADLAPRETRKYLLIPRALLSAVPPVVARAHARFVPERLDDFAWENDKVAHRTYGPALVTDPKEHLVSSGIDVWSKSVRKLVQDRWYRSADYHHDKGEGLDFYHVGSTRGCGGLGIYQDGKLYTSSNFVSWKILADGPLRTVFELRYAAWDVAGRAVSETRRISLDAGSYFSRVESRFSSALAGELMVGVGMVQRAGSGSYGQGVDSMSYWEPAQGDNGSNACGVIVPQARQFVDLPLPQPRPLEQGHYLALAPLQPEQTLVYYLGAAWSRGGEFSAAPAWQAYVRQSAERLAQPAEVRYVAAQAQPY